MAANPVSVSNLSIDSTVLPPTDPDTPFEVKAAGSLALAGNAATSRVVNGQAAVIDTITYSLNNGDEYGITVANPFSVALPGAVETVDVGIPDNTDTEAQGPTVSITVYARDAVNGDPVGGNSKTVYVCRAAATDVVPVA